MDRRGIPEVLAQGGTVYTCATAHELITEGRKVRGARGFIIERTLGRFSTLTETGEQDRVIDLEVEDGGPTFLNPHDVVVVATVEHRGRRPRRARA